MPIPKLPKKELATSHLLVTEKEKKIIYQIAKKQNEKVSEVVRRMINAYVVEIWSEREHVYFFNKFFIDRDLNAH